MNGKIKSEDKPQYHLSRKLIEDKLIHDALIALEHRLKRGEGTFLENPEETKKFVTLSCAELEHEEFSVLFLDNRHQMIEMVSLFRGTIDGASGYPREVVKEALKRNAAAVVFCHNHPSGNPDPSQADRTITKRLQEALSLMEIRTLDHIIVGGMETISFAERGYL